MMAFIQLPAAICKSAGVPKNIKHVKLCKPNDGTKKLIIKQLTFQAETVWNTLKLLISQ